MAFGDLVLGDADLAGLLDDDVLADGALASLGLQGLDDLKRNSSMKHKSFYFLLVPALHF